MMQLLMKENGQIIKEMAKESSFGRMALAIMVSGKKEEWMVMEPILTLMETNTLANGTKIVSTVMELSFTRVVPNI